MKKTSGWESPRITPKDIPGFVASAKGVVHITADGILGGDYTLIVQRDGVKKRKPMNVKKKKDVKKERDVKNPLGELALDRHRVQKHFREELTIDDICTVLRKKRAILNACSMLKLSVEERADFFLVDAQGKNDLLQSDYLALRHMDHLLRALGYSGMNDRTKSIKLGALEFDANVQARETTQETELAEDVDGMDVADAQETTREVRDAARKLAGDVGRKLDVIRKIRRNVRIKTDSIVTEMKGILKNLIGLNLDRTRGPRPERVSEYKMQEMDDIWRIARIPNDFFDAKWKAAMTVKVADLRKNSKRKREEKANNIDGVQQLLVGSSEEIWEW